MDQDTNMNPTPVTPELEENGVVIPEVEETEAAEEVAPVEADSETDAA
jgi:hypothetical protein